MPACSTDCLLPQDRRNQPLDVVDAQQVKQGFDAQRRRVQPTPGLITRAVARWQRHGLRQRQIGSTQDQMRADGNPAAMHKTH